VVHARGLKGRTAASNPLEPILVHFLRRLAYANINCRSELAEANRAACSARGRRALFRVPGNPAIECTTLESGRKFPPPAGTPEIEE
jgi:hypothetical protein